MKKILLLCVMAGAAFTGSYAQYNKAERVNTYGGRAEKKDGVWYDFGTLVRPMGSARKGGQGFAVTFGRYKPGRPTFWSHDLEYIRPISYSGTLMSSEWDKPSIPVSFTGKSSGGWSYRLNFGGVLKNSENSTSAIKPFFNVSGGFLFVGMDERNTVTTPSDRQNPYDFLGEGGWVYGAALGMHYNFTPKSGVRLSVGYNNVADESANYTRPFSIISSHFYVHLAYHLVRSDK